MTGSFQNSNFKRDALKVFCVAAVLAGAASIFLLNPTLSSPTLISIIFAMLCSPLVAILERKGYPRGLSIGIIFVVLGGLFTFLTVWLAQSISAEWASFSQKVPQYFEASVQRISEAETKYKAEYPFLDPVHPTETIVRWGRQTGEWFLSNGPQIVGDFVTWLFIVPILSFFFLKDGTTMQKRFFQLVPNRLFESAFVISSKVTDSISDYIRAKLMEAFLVGGLTTLGFWIIGGPYSVVLGIIAGITNIVPYLGPFIGAAPGIAIAVFDPAFTELLWPIIAVYGIANAIDMGFIFPVLVAKLVNLHPLFLIAAVILGGQYGGVVGMLISIPVAAAIKVILVEVYLAVYETARRPSELNSQNGEAKQSHIIGL